ncbi:MAG: transglycosylase domain-containing protein [Deltaproteobacteria bacterium]|nr:transglycosylase domain-containing protein [Deltaproteobacteria bacterium]
MQTGSLHLDFSDFERRKPVRKVGLGRALKVGLLILGIGLAALFTVNVAVRYRALPEFAAVRLSHKPSDQWLVDRQGRALESIRTGQDQRSLDWVKLDEVSAGFLDLLILAEDRRFHHHFGVDPLALLSAAWSGTKGDFNRGASTITMQMVKSVSEGQQSVPGWSSYFSNQRIVKKLSQLASATALELKWSKDEILEAYINRVSFRGEVVGLRAASHGFFSKSPLALNLPESAILVSLIRSPNAPKLKVGRRACAMLGVEHCQDVQLLLDDSLDRPFKIVRERRLVPVVSNRFMAGNFQPAVSGPRSLSVIETTLDYQIQKLAMDLLKEQLNELRHQNVGDGAVLVLETRTGKPLAYVANGGPDASTAVQVDGIQSRRQLGSTIKPFVYAEAFELDVLATTTLLMDSPENVAVGSGQVYQPRNYDYQFRGAVGAAEALASSLNVPAVRTLDLVGERRVVERLKVLGFEKLMTEDMYGPSLALGTVDATLWELAQGYRHFSLYSGSAIYSENTKRKLFESLSVPENRRFTFGIHSLLQLPFPAAVKTGTSKDMRDNWCVGYTSEYTVAVWVGNFNGDPMWNVSGISGAAPLWRSLMLGLHKDRLPEDPRMYYLTPERPLVRRSIARIQYPVKDMLIGLDPDIPKESQLVPLRAEGASRDMNFYVNGLKLGSASETRFWMPKKGRHKIELRGPKVGSGKNQTVDEVSFVVR